MRILLDTHAFIWVVQDKARLSAGARDLVHNPQTESLVSIASLWEMAIKSNKGKLELADPLPQFIDEGLRVHSIGLLSVRLNHVFRFEQLRRVHNDPFDGMIAAQALEEDLPIIGRDRMLDEYGVDRRW
jgi:PIN domain nuclease of toxin-antitoxin system